jgi:hypothetical protein
MQRGILLITVLVMAYASSSLAASWPLVTQEEFRQEQKAAAAKPGTPKAERRSLSVAPAGAPVIEVEQPDEAKPIKSPVTIKIRFRTQNGAAIDKSSLRITYGFLQIDITKRVLEHAQLTGDGLIATDAVLPSGQHNVTLQIADSKGRVTSKSVSLTVL